MKYHIDPTIDCVFKALLGSEENKNLLINFLNAVIDPQNKSPIVTVEIRNPYNEKKFLSDKLSIVDIKAEDNAKRLHQIEIQLATYTALAARMSYILSDLYASQLKKGEQYDKLKPVIAIWIIPGTFFQDTPFHHHFQLYDAKNRLLLNNHLSLHVLELQKWNKTRVDKQLDRWVKFLREGKDLDDKNLPKYMQTKEMRQAMSTLRQFSEKERHYSQYQSRLNYLREQRSIEAERKRIAQKLDQVAQERDQTAQKLDQAAQERDQAAQERDQARQREQTALAEIKRLRKILQ